MGNLSIEAQCIVELTFGTLDLLVSSHGHPNSACSSLHSMVQLVGTDGKKGATIFHTELGSRVNPI